MKERPTEKELLEGLDSHGAHADELAVPSDNEWCHNADPDNRYEEAKGQLNPAVADDRISDNESLQGYVDQREVDRRPLERLRGSVKHFDGPTMPLDNWDAWFEDHGVSDDFGINRDQPRQEGPLYRMVKASQHQITQLANNYGCCNVRLFGSVARGDESPNSDIDLLVEASDTTALFDLGGLQIDLEKLLGATVDLLTPGDVPRERLEALRASAISIDCL